jgi:hypothetical protein
MSLNLSSDERIIWQGKPAQGFRLSPQDVFAVPFAIFWLLMVLTIFGSILTGGATHVDPMAFIILPVFILVGIYLLIGRFIVDRLARRRTNYYLTNQRALIETGLFRSALISVSLLTLPEVRFRSGRRERGTIQFGSSSARFGMIPSSWPGARQFQPPTFEDIDDGQRVFQLAIAAQREAQMSRISD